MYQLRIDIQVGKFEIWRRVLVPRGATFYDLHRVIQTVFDWQDSHLHEFFTLVDAAGFTDDMPACLCPRKDVIVDRNGRNWSWVKETENRLDEKEIVLSDVFDKTDLCIYHYDFTDDWCHIIRLEKVVDGADCVAGEGNGNNGAADTKCAEGGCEKAKLLDREGTRPPEGVGGETGFEDFVRVVEDKRNPFREQMLDWVEGLEERELTIDEINCALEAIC